ncbi:sorbosone dehydrogenase, partial [Caulobacter sp. HMWF009]
MPNLRHPAALTLLALSVLAACSPGESQTPAVGYGANPALPAPTKTLLPTVKV